MAEDQAVTPALAGRRIALLESREAARLGHMLAAQGAEIVACPMVAVVEPADPAPVVAWVHRLIAEPCEVLVLLTGEGLDRLHAGARRSGVANEFVAAVARATTITRGPKPARALRALGLNPSLRADPPTSEGVAAILRGLALQGRRVGIQLYPSSADNPLLDLLVKAGARPDPVTPYAYAANAADAAVMTLVDRLAAGDIDAIAFTSASQVRRLFEVADAAGARKRLSAGLGRTAVAAVGPLAAAELARHGAAAEIVPHGAYFMKPLVSAIAAALGSSAVAARPGSVHS